MRRIIVNVKNLVYTILLLPGLSHITPIHPRLLHLQTWRTISHNHGLHLRRWSLDISTILLMMLVLLLLLMWLLVLSLTLPAALLPLAVDLLVWLLLVLLLLALGVLILAVAILSLMRPKYLLEYFSNMTWKLVLMRRLHGAAQHIILCCRILVTLVFVGTRTTVMRTCNIVATFEAVSSVIKMFNIVHGLVRLGALVSPPHSTLSHHILDWL